MAKVRRDPALYARLVELHRREGIPWREAAEAAGVPLSTLMGWASRLGRGAKGGERRSFVELAPREECALAADRVEIVLRSGRRLLLPWRPEALADLVALLERPC